MTTVLNETASSGWGSRLELWTVIESRRYRTISELENSVLEFNHVTNMTTVLNETAGSGLGSRWGIGSGVFLNLLMVSACFWRVRLCFGRGRDRGFVLYIFLFLRVLGWCVCVCIRAYTHTNYLGT